MSDKTVVLESVNTTGSLQVNEVEVYLNFVKLDLQTPTVVAWNQTNTLEVKIRGNKSSSAVSSLPVVKQISDDSNKLLAEICIREY